jgi:hypothetical protein
VQGPCRCGITQIEVQRRGVAAHLRIYQALFCCVYFVPVQQVLINSLCRIEMSQPLERHGKVFAAHYKKKMVFFQVFSGSF